MPAPMITPMPKTVRSRAVRFFLSLKSGSSVSLIECSTDLVRKTFMRGTLPPDARWRGPGRVAAPAQSGHGNGRLELVGTLRESWRRRQTRRRPGRCRPT